MFLQAPEKPFKICQQQRDHSLSGNLLKYSLTNCLLEDEKSPVIISVGIIKKFGITKEGLTNLAVRFDAFDKVYFCGLSDYFSKLNLTSVSLDKHSKIDKLCES